MRKFILPILLLHLAVAVNAATYYFSSSSGNDSRSTSQAQNPSTPWQSISKLNSIMYLLQPGDQVLFRSGDVFQGGIVVAASGNSSQPITFGSYGSGNQPVISGFSTVTNWTPVRNNVWEAPFWQPNGLAKMVTRNNQQQGIGRYPNVDAGNGGYLNVDANNGSTQITSNSLPSSPNWTGADIVVRKNHWTLDRSTIYSHSGNTVNFASSSSNTISNNYGFFVVNSTNTLDEDGEWFYDNSRAKLQMYFNGTDPNAYTVQSSTVETLATISFNSYIAFNNLTFIGANSYAFKLTNSNNITINNCNINFTGTDAINALSSDYFTISNSTISNSNNDALNLYWSCDYATIQYTTIKNSGLIAGMGQNGGGATTNQGIYINGNNNLIQYSEIDNTGHDGIHFEGDWSTVQNNYINTFGLILDDCGGIYTGQGINNYTVYNSKSVLNNIVVNGIGANAGTDDPTYTPAIGIYFDENTNHTVAIGNTAANCAFAGFFSHNANNVSIQNNTFYNNGVQQFLGVRTTNPNSNVVFQNNICFSKTADQLTSKLQSYYGTNNLPQFGTFSNNYYCRPIDNNYMFYSMYEIGNSGQYNTYNQNLNTWQSGLGLDAASQTSPATIPSFVASSPSGVNLFSNGSFTNSIDGASIWSPTGDIASNYVSQLDGGTLQISANNYSSNSFYISLMTNNSVTAGQGYQLSFTMQGAGSGSPVTVYLKQQNASGKTMSKQVLVPVSTTRQDYQFGFTPTMSGKVTIELDVAQPNGAIWLDNVVLQQAAIWPTNPNDFIIFAYNPTTSNMQVGMPKGDKFFDATGKKYNNNTVLKPYTSIVLFKQLIINGSANSVAQQSISLAGGLVDATASSAVNSTATKLTWKVDNQDSAASYYEVQRSSDAQSFTTIGKATVTASNSTATTYQYQDASPLAGKSYYRITQRNNKDSVSSTSQMVQVNNISFKINPNPAKDVIHISFDEMINAADHLDKDIAIRSAAGVTVQTVTLPSTDNLNRVDINVANLQRGVYILSVSSEGKSFSKKFIKE